MTSSVAEPTAVADGGKVTTPPVNADDYGKPVRLSVNLAPDVAEALKHWTLTKHLSITEGIRRAIAVWNFLELERAKGNTLAVIEKDSQGERVREIVLV